MKKLITLAVTILFSAQCYATSMGITDAPNRTVYACPDLGAIGSFTIGSKLTDAPEWFVKMMYSTDNTGYMTHYDYLDNGLIVNFDESTIYNGLKDVTAGNVWSYSSCDYTVVSDQVEYTVQLTLNKPHCIKNADGVSFSCIDTL